jgi:predicted acyl esterase
MRKFAGLIALIVLFWAAVAQSQERADPVAGNYTKTEQVISMRDGVKLFTSIYSPRDTSRKYPIMLNRTPYSVAPYGADAYKESLGPSSLFQNERYIFVYQDVRGRLMSEGEYENIRPHKTKKSGPKDIDESTDTYDTIEWLLKNVPNNNGRVGMWGISYPGFYVDYRGSPCVEGCLSTGAHRGLVYRRRFSSQWRALPAPYV